jgi:GrpB-like predicted nucleotidyltransferase (UPF0157 family)
MPNVLNSSMSDGMIVIVPYKPSWPSEYAAIAARIRAAAGDGIVAVHHIGSTGVPGLAAKDIIDVQIAVADIAAADRLPLAGAGFMLGAPRTDHCPPGMTLPPEQLEKRFYKLGDRLANIHIRVAGRFNQRYPLLCRDYLRTHPGAADAYGVIKQELARLHPDDQDAYYAIKDPVFDVIMAGAEDWAAQTGWSLPPGD